MSYDVGRVLGGNRRPEFNPTVVRRELEIIKEDLHCNAVRICGRDLDRLAEAGGIALDTGLDAWLSPELWNKSPRRTYRYIVEAAAAAETLRREWPDKGRPLRRLRADPLHAGDHARPFPASPREVVPQGRPSVTTLT